MLFGGPDTGLLTVKRREGRSVDQRTKMIDAAPNPVDQHVGLRIRVRRKELQVSQERLAEAIGVTFQQLQKYERAANRVSASKLWEIARFLAVPPGFFFEGLGEVTPSPASRASAFLSLPEGMDIAETFPRIRLSHVRRHIAGLIRTLAYAEAGEAAYQTRQDLRSGEPEQSDAPRRPAVSYLGRP